jgi:hypothetical protein
MVVEGKCKQSSEEQMSCFVGTEYLILQTFPGSVCVLWGEDGEESGEDFWT